MFKKLYQQSIKSILHFFNYNKIEDINGTTHIALNVCDMLLASVYAGISYWKLYEVTFLVLAVNFLTLLRLALGSFKKSINIRDQYEAAYLSRPGLRFKSAHDIKLIIELCVIAFSLMPFVFQGVILETYVIRSFAMVIISLSLADNFLNIFAELFKASMDITKI